MLADAYRSTFPHRPQPRVPLADGVRKTIQAALKKRPIEEWLAFFSAIEREGREGWLWTNGSLGMFMRESTIDQWDMGQYRPNLREQAVRGAPRTVNAAEYRDAALDRIRASREAAAGNEEIHCG